MLPRCGAETSSARRFIEEALYATQLVGEVLAFSVTRPSLGQAIVVVATPKPGGELEAGVLLAACRDRLPIYMLPAKIDIRRKSSDMNPTSEVLVCTYNGAAVVVEQLQSILNQTTKVDKISIYDDRSSEDTVSRIHDFVNELHATEQRLFQRNLQRQRHPFVRLHHRVTRSSPQYGMEDAAAYD